MKKSAHEMLAITPGITLREKMAITMPESDDPDVLAALMLVLYERGKEGVTVDEIMETKRVDDLMAMTDEEFDQEHKRVMKEKEDERTRH